MNATLFSYGSLSLAIVCEVLATVCLERSEQFSKFGPTALMVSLYVGSFYFLTQALKTVPLGVAYAVWGSLGIVLTTTIGLVFFKQRLDLPGAIGIAMILSGVMVLQLFSGSVSH